MKRSAVCGAKVCFPGKQHVPLRDYAMLVPKGHSYNSTTLQSKLPVLLMEVSQPLSLPICLVRSDRLCGCCCMRVGDGQHPTLATMDSRCYGMHSCPWLRDGGRRWDLCSRILALALIDAFFQSVFRIFSYSPRI